MYIWVTRLVYYLKQELLFRRKHMSSLPVFLWVPCCLSFYFLCCPIVCLYVLGFMLWCPLRFPHGIDVRFEFASSCLWGTRVLFVLFVFVCVWWCPVRIVLCVYFVFLRLLCPMLPVSLDCSFVIASWPYSLMFILTVNIHDH